MQMGRVDMNYTDAYCHVGLPRFGTAEDALAVLETMGVQKAVLVLGPMVPDLTTLFAVMRAYPDRARGVGLTFGETAAQYTEIIEAQIRGGVMGIRIWSGDVERYPDAARLIGEAGRCLYALSPHDSPDTAAMLVGWLERYPHGRVAAPHFLSPGPLPRGPLRDLLAHPRFFAIFSRHGGVGSKAAYPHDDLRSWTESVVELCGWERVMWGSEYPVLFWRNETLESAVDWLEALGLRPNPTERALFLGGNAQREFFVPPAPASERVTTPAWVEAQFDRARHVPLFPHTTLEIPQAVYQRLHARFAARLRTDPSCTFARFISEVIVDAAARGENNDALSSI